jgi:hypothetical protein
MVRNVITVLIVVFLGGVFQRSPTFACSGGGLPPTLSEFISYVDVVVQGQMVMVDEQGQNGVLQVESILAGDPTPEYILLALNPSRWIHRENERFSGGACFHGVTPPLNTSITMIIFLNRLPDGTFGLGAGPGDYYSAFPLPDSRVSISIGNAKPDEVTGTPMPNPPPLVVDLKGYTQLIAEAVGHQPKQPQRDTPYPLPTSLYIRTETGTEYVLPVDFSPPLLLTQELALEIGGILQPGCVVANCIGASPLGFDTAQVMPDGTVQILSFGGMIAPGNAFIFSTTSDAIAVWGRDTINIYALPFGRLGFCCGELVLINSLALSNGSLPTAVAWSPDGRMIAYNDGIGLYLWDALTPGSQPRLLLPHLYDPLAPRFFSATGRYLAVQRGDERFYLDLVSNSTLPDGMLSPNDRNLLEFDTTQTTATLRLYHLAPNRYPPYPVATSGARQAEWMNEGRYLVARCEPESPTECSVVEIGLVSTSNLYQDSYAFAYDPLTQTIAFAQSGQRITVNNYTHDFSAVLDSEIETIEWMQPIFYRD